MLSMDDPKHVETEARKTVELFGVDVDVLTTDETIAAIRTSLCRRELCSSARRVDRLGVIRA